MRRSRSLFYNPKSSSIIHTVVLFELCQANRVIGNSFIPSVLFMLEPSVATISICLPAISSLVTQGFKRYPLSSIRSTWSKQSYASRSTRRGTIMTFCPAFKTFPSADTSRSTVDDKKPFMFPNSRRTTLDEKADHIDTTDRDIKRTDEISVFLEEPRPTVTKGDGLERRIPTKSLELERRIQRFYERSTFPHGSDGTLAKDLESGPESPLRRNPIPVPPKDMFRDSRW